MTNWEDYTNDEWFKPKCSRETELRVVAKSRTRGVRKSPKLAKCPWKAGDVVAGYQLGECLGSGSQGWVFAAKRLGESHEFALKLFHIGENRRESDLKAAMRAKSGFRKMSQLYHGGLVRAYRIHNDEGCVAFSMERIHGENLVKAIRRWRKLPLDEACDRILRMLRQVASALSWMHANRLIHRDIKPSNIMVTHDDQRFVIIDCDLTGAFDDAKDAGNARPYLVFTPMYVAPEVMFRQTSYSASDIFSLGMVVLEALRVVSSAQRRRDAANEFKANDPITIDPEKEDDAVPRDEDNLKADRQYIDDALTGLHPDIPELIVDAVREMVTHQIPDRPTAISLARLGQPIVNLRPRLWGCMEGSRARHITKLSRQSHLRDFERWCHLILGGQVQRLHIDGMSGIGKSTFLDLALDSRALQQWAQIFVARCQRFEERPLQAFSQIADEIVMRYRRGTMEKLRVDPVTESILQRSLPGFSEVMKVDWSLPPLVTSSSRPGGREAAMIALNQLRKIGPIFFVIDDVQWADRDTVNVLDHIQTAESRTSGPDPLQGFGIITISRPNTDPISIPPDETIYLGPLRQKIVTNAIRDEASIQGLSFDQPKVQAIVDQIEGLPYRLEAYLTEMSPTGLLYESFQNDASKTASAPTIEQVWMHRKEQLHATKRDLLRLICVAGREVSLSELDLVRQNECDLEIDLDDLVEKRLVVRDDADGHTVRIWHDRLSRRIFDATSPSELRDLHLRWANGLANFEGKSPAEVATHFDKAGETSMALIWAEKAAAEAMQYYAHSEAARWHRYIADHCEATAKQVQALHKAAELLGRGGRLADASATYQQLAEILDGQAKIEAELNSVQALIRSGNFSIVADQLLPLSDRLLLPRPKTVWRTKTAILARLARRFALAPFRSSDPLPENSGQRDILQDNQISACMKLVRPLSFIDNWWSAELNVFVSELISRIGTRKERIEVAVGEAVFGSYRPGRARQKARKKLKDLEKMIPELDDPSIRGDIYAGLAWSAGMNGQWKDVLTPVANSRRCYSRSEDYKGFEIAHTSYIESTACYQLGRLEHLVEMVDDMLEESATAGDQFILAMSTLGAASVAMLLRDQLDRLEKNHQLISDEISLIGPDGFALIVQLKELLLAVYLDRPNQPTSTIQPIETSVRSSPVYRVEFIEVFFKELFALLAYQNLSSKDTKRFPEFRRRLKSLRQHQFPSAKSRADLLEAIALLRFPEFTTASTQSQRDRAEKLLRSVQTTAREQQLLPTQLAAEDELHELSSGVPGTALEEFLAEQGAVVPDRVARLYRGR